MPFALKLLGGVALTGEAGPLSGPAVQRHRLALLAVLAASQGRAVGRDKLLALLWPERDGESARRLLNQAVHALRRALAADALVTSGDELRLNPTVVSCDVVSFEQALAAGELRQAVTHYTGPFLDGFFLGEAPEFEHWVERERERLAAACGRVLEQLAEREERAGDPNAAVEWWQRRSALDPYDSRVAIRLGLALERAGNRAGAIQHARQHQERLRLDLEIDSSPEVGALVDRLRREPVIASVSNRAPPPVSFSAPAPPPPAPPRRRRTPVVVILALVALLGPAAWLWSRARGRAAGATPSVDEIARAVAREIDRRARGDMTPALPPQSTKSIPAYELFLRGNDPTLLRSDSGARRGLQYFERAVTLDSAYAAAWAGIARMTLRVAGTSATAAAARARAESAATRAVALDDSLAEAHALLGLLRSMAYDFTAAERQFKRALELEPRRARTREWVAAFYLVAERPIEALAEAERALALEPLSPTATAELARALVANGRCDEALERLAALQALEPPLLRVAPIAARCYEKKGQSTEAAKQLRPQARRGDALATALLGHALARAGQRDEALSIQAGIAQAWSERTVGAYYLAFVPAALGDRDQAFTWLDRSIVDGSLGFSSGLGIGLASPLADDLRADPRWEELRRRLGLPEKAKAGAP